MSKRIPWYEVFMAVAAAAIGAGQFLVGEYATKRILLGIGWFALAAFWAYRAAHQGLRRKSRPGLAARRLLLATALLAVGTGIALLVF